MGFGKDHKGVIIRESVTLTIGALGAGSVVLHTSGAALQTTSFRMIKAVYTISQLGAWAADGDEVLIGIANGELSTQEIAECLTAQGPDDRNDALGSEQAGRAVWVLADIKDTSVTGFAFSDPINDGMPMEKVLRWTFTPTAGWNWFAFNPLTGTLTTGAVFKVIATYYGVWVD